MIEYDKIKYTELKKVVLSVNESGFLTKNIRHVAVKGPKLYDDFITSIEALSDETKMELPDDVIDFFNHSIDETESEQEEPEEIEPEEVQEVEDEQEAPVEAQEEQEVVEAQEKPEEATEVQEEAPESKEEIPLDEKPKGKIKRLTTDRMTPKIENGKLTISFKSLNISETFKLPKIGNPAELKPVRKEAMEFATANGATKGQLCNISKTLNMAGYYAR